MVSNKGDQPVCKDLLVQQCGFELCEDMFTKFECTESLGGFLLEIISLTKVKLANHVVCD